MQAKWWLYIIFYSKGFIQNKEIQKQISPYRTLPSEICWAIPFTPKTNLLRFQQLPTYFTRKKNYSYPQKKPQLSTAQFWWPWFNNAWRNYINPTQLAIWTWCLLQSFSSLFLFTLSCLRAYLSLLYDIYLIFSLLWNLKGATQVCVLLCPIWLHSWMKSKIPLHNANWKLKSSTLVLSLF